MAPASQAAVIVVASGLLAQRSWRGLALIEPGRTELAALGSRACLDRDDFPGWTTSVLVSIAVHFAASHSPARRHRWHCIDARAGKHSTALESPSRSFFRFRFQRSCKTEPAAPQDADVVDSFREV